MTSAEGTKNNNAARIHKLIEDVPLCAAAATQRGPSTVAMLKRRTSQKPISLRNCLIGSEEPFAVRLTESRPARESIHPPCGNFWGRDGLSFKNRPGGRKRFLGFPEKKRPRRQVSSPGGCHASRRSMSFETLSSGAGSTRPCVPP